MILELIIFYLRVDPALIACELQNGFCCGGAEGGRAFGVRRIGPERGADHRPADRQRPPRPPDMERGDVTVPDGLFAPVVRGDALDGQVNFDEAFGVAAHEVTGRMMLQQAAIRLAKCS